MNRGKILWVDDEIELLRSHIMFLEEKGYEVTPVTNADDAIALITQRHFDLVLLDEMMSGKDGLAALAEIKDFNPSLPVVMITKNEEESLMEEAIGGKIDDYLTKPINPSQILSTCKKFLERYKIGEERISRDYAMEFNQITQACCKHCRTKSAVATLNSPVLLNKIIPTGFTIKVMRLCYR